MHVVLSPGNRMTEHGPWLSSDDNPDAEVREAWPPKLAAEAKGEQTAIRVGPIDPAPLTVDYGLLPAAQNGRCCG